MPRRSLFLRILVPVVMVFGMFVLPGAAAPAGGGGAAAGKKAPDLVFFGAKELLPARQALMEGRFEEALGLLEAAASGEHREEALLRMGSCLISLDRYKEALAGLEMLTREFPEGRLFHKARFLEAEALSGLKRYNDAAAIYEKEIDHLISKDRKEEIAGYYLRYADSLAAKDREGGPRYDKAIDLYRRALDLEIPGLIDEEIRFKIAGALHELGKYGEEEKVLAAFKKRHPKSPSLDEVDFRIARARLLSKRLDEARKGLRDFLRDHPSSIRVPEARYDIALTYRVPEPRNDTELSLGVKALEEFIEKSPGDKLAPKARYEIGASYMHRGRLDEAIAAFKGFTETYGDKEEIPQLPLARFDLAACYQGQKKYAAALAAYKEFLAKHPAHELWDDAQRRIVAADFEWGVSLIKAGKFDEARNRLLDFVGKYPLDERTRKAYFALGYLEVKREKYKAAIREWERLVSKYPKSDLASQAQYRIGLLLETKLLELEEALKAYEKVDFGPYRNEARARIAAMKAKTLKVVTERAFTSDETPKVKITTRNIEKLSMRAYRIDLEDYFVKRGTIYSVEDLDIDLIAPEEKWTAPVEDYRKYAEMTREVELPFNESGAYVLNVSDEERTATALVLISDLQMILKSGREDVLVFVEDVRNKTPFPGASVIVSDGKKVLFRGKTGGDGVFHKEDPSLKTAPSLRVLVSDGGNFASNNLNLQGVAAAEGLRPKAFLFTDKPVYRPGQKVRLKGFLREVSRGRYTFSPGDEYSLILYGPGGRAVDERSAASDAFGGVDAAFLLARSAPLGAYRVELRARSGWTQNLSFPVGEYVPPRVTIEADLPADVFYQGGKVKGAFKVFYNYGEPAKGKTVRYSYGTGVTLEGVVGDDGKVPFEIDTRDFGGSGPYLLAAEVLDENAAFRKILYIADTGFSLKVNLSREVILSGEQVSATVEAARPDGKPAGAEAQLRVIFLEKKDGVLSEKEIRRIEGVRVDKETGRGAAVVRLDKGGDYRIRAAARDRFGNLITAERDLFVSGEEDKVRLRIFADAAAYDAGSEASIRVHTRTDPGLALLTCEGERVFHYEVRRLERGDNTVPLAIDPALAPNFTFAAALMEGHKFHKASVDLNVRSSLKVTVEPETKEVPPGGRVKVKIAAADRAGRPVEGEFALAAVDSALLSRFPDETGPIHDFFFGRHRAGRLKTDSSCTFEYKARTRTINEALKEEQLRRQELSRAAMEGTRLLAEGKELEPAEEVLEEESVNDAIGVGGGAGGVFRGKYQRRKEKKAEGYAASKGRPGQAAPAAGRSVRGAATGGMARRRYKGAGNAAFGAPAEKKSALGERLKSLGYLGGDRLGADKRVLDGAQWAMGKAAFLAMDEDLRKSGAAAEMVRKGFLETAYWNPSVRTGPDGSAEVEIDLPDNTTTWKLVVRGLTKETVGGQAEAEVRAGKSFFAELVAPRSLVEGDETMFTARVVNRGSEEVEAEVNLVLDGPVSKDSGGKRTIEIAAGDSREISFPVKVSSPGLVAARLEARAGVRKDAVAGTVSVKPMGVEITAGRGGTAKGSWKETISLPAGRNYTHTYMEVEVGPSLSEVLLDMAKASRRYSCLPTLAGTASRVLVKLSALDYLRRTGRAAAGGGALNIEKSVKDLLSALLLAQGDNGGFPWIRKGAVSPLATAQALKALARADAMGFSVPGKAIFTAAAWISKYSRTLSGGEKAFFLHAYSFYRKPEFTFLNSLFRQRAVLSNQGLALLSLAFRRSGHKDAADTLAGMLVDRAGEGAAPWVSTKKEEEIIEDEKRIAAGWMGDETMTVAYATLAVALSRPRSPVVEKGIGYLLGNSAARRRIGPAYAAVAAALDEYLAGASLEASDYTLAVVVNGREIETLEVEGPHPVERISVPRDSLVPGENEVAFRFAGRGKYSWSVRMSGFTRDARPRDFDKSRVMIERRYLMAPLVHKGRKVPSGFDTVELPKSFKKWRHDLEEIDQGETARVSLSWKAARGGRDGLNPLVLTDTLPAGCRVVESGITGSFDHYEIGPGTITFYVRGSQAQVTYPIYAAFPGSFRAPPAVVRSVYDPAVANNSTPFALPVHERGTPKKASYRMTPDELYYLGIALYEDNDTAGALARLEDYLKKYVPREKNLVNAARRLFRIAFDSGDDERLVRYFELLRERAPSLSLTFQETARVGSAYRARGEFEQALQILAMVAGSSFGREAKVSEALEKQGEIAGSLLFLSDQIRSYPDLPEIRSAFFALSQAVLDKAGPAGGRPAIRGLSRSRVMSAGIDLLVDFLATYPKSPVADEAAYSLVSALLDQERSAGVVRLCPLFRKRWPKSRYSTSLEYAEAYALFETGQYGEATALLKKVADLDPGKLDPEERDNRDLALYILGQIDHAAGRIAEAVGRYRQVMKKFADAAEAVDYFTRKSVSLPEISTFRSGEEVKVKLGYRNVPEVTLSVYKVDLMKLCLLRKSLNNITDINLAGISPALVEKVSLGKGLDYEDKEKELKLSLGEKGAYMVVVQGEAAGCTGMVLVTDLSLDVQEDPASGRVRVNVKDAGTDRFLKDVYVKVIGSRQSAFRSGYTDLRGVFIADGVAGKSTVIAERKGEFAFHRGSLALLEKPQRDSEWAKRKNLEEGRGRALKNVFSQNRAMQQQGAQSLEQIFQKDFKNVRIK